MADLTTAQVWKEIEDNIFAVLGMVSAKQEARTAGIVYLARGGKLYISSHTDAWKATWPTTRTFRSRLRFPKVSL